jgi:hypothetical protein
MRAGGVVSSIVLIVRSGSKLDAAYGMYKWSSREISQVSIFVSIFWFWKCKNVFSNSLLNSVAPLGFCPTVVKRRWNEKYFLPMRYNEEFSHMFTNAQASILSSDKEFLLYLGTTRLKNYIRVILQEVSKQPVVNRILICIDNCRWIGVSGFYLQWQW